MSLIELLEGIFLGLIVLGKNEGLDELLALTQEHVLCTIEAYAFSTKVTGELGVCRVVSIGTHTKGVTAVWIKADLVSPLQHGLEVACQLRAHERHSANDDVACCTVNGDHVALVKHHIGAGNLNDLVLRIDLQRLSAANARGTHPTRNDCGVGGLATMACQNAFGSNHATQVIWSRLPTNEHAGGPSLFCCNSVSR